MNASCETAPGHPAVLAPASAPRVPWTLRLARALDLVLDWHERARQRRHLAGLPDHMLHDLGLSRADVARETRKPFWMA
ncbi:MAG: DUF1127 domain-containing protein [Hyphomicrobiales bacterium]|nr:DUF1127 domain-containing protein [Hyphomicrobiales bacterium]MCP5373166.1 DUF1127 domain-containing protein [Hyphomicrobiales bacterium]